jgi:hypothetical protein
VSKSGLLVFLTPEVIGGPVDNPGFNRSG